MNWNIRSMSVDGQPVPGLAEQIAGLARERGLRVTEETGLREILETLAEGSAIRVSLMLALGEIMGEVFRHDRALAAEAADADEATTISNED